MAYVPPKFKDTDGNVYEGEKALEEGLKKSSDMGILAIPNRPFSGKPIKLAMGKNPPDGDYRKPLTESELDLLRKAVPGLSIRAVDSMPELTDLKLELFLRKNYNMGDLRTSDLTWSNIFEACKDYTANSKSLAEVQDSSTLPNEPITLIQFMERYCEKQSGDLLKSRRKYLQMTAQKDKIQLPIEAKPWKAGQSKYYFTHDLLKQWSGYCEKSPNLPELDSQKITKAGSKAT